jgi:hypothetical protein
MAPGSGRDGTSSTVLGTHPFSREVMIMRVAKQWSKGGAIAILAIGLVLLWSTPAFAQQGRGGWGAGSPYNRLYDPATVETIRGEVVGVDQVSPMKGMSYGVHLRVETGEGVLPVHLGPAWYLDNQEAHLAVGDEVEVTGSRVQFDGAPAIIAAEVRRGEQILQLRDPGGFPRWSGWRGRGL